MLLPDSVRFAPLQREPHRAGFADPVFAVLFFARKVVDYLKMNAGLGHRGCAVQMPAHEA